MRYIVPPRLRYPEKYSFLLSHLLARPVDRSGALELSRDAVVLKPVPRFDASFSMDFAAVCRQVAGRIVAQAGPRVTVLWSGGIDSTCVLSSFLLIGAKVDVALSDESVRENPSFYRAVIAGHPLIGEEFRFSNIAQYLRRRDAEATHVSGELADQIYFITYPGYALGDDELFDAPVGHGIPEPYMDLYRPLIAACPVRLANNYDFLWWENFALKYQSVQARIHLHAGRRLENLVHFFEDALFEQWAMANGHGVKCPNRDLRNHKYPARKLIHELFPHESVFLMRKQKSLIKAIGRPAGPDAKAPVTRADWCIDEHWNVLAGAAAGVH
jgi:hypothetical protein